MVRYFATVLALVALTGCNQAKKPAETETKASEASEAEAEAKTEEADKPGTIPAPEDVAAPPADAEKTESGLASKVLTAGSGEQKPEPQDKVKVHYTGWTTDGKMFDSSVQRGNPTTFGVTQVIPGWTEALQLMTKGEKRRLWIPEELAYKGRPGPQGMLVFDVELLDIVPGPKPIPAPEDVAAPPADAKKEKSGLATKVLSKATGKDKARSFDKVKVHYTGWTTDGKMFDSSVQRGRPAVFGVDRVIPGWTEGLQLMKVGEKRRMWIPEDLAYKGRQGPPKGMLVFDVELLEVIKMEPPPETPKDVAEPPKNAKKTDSGLAYRVLKRGKGKKSPVATDRVKVNYTGWTTDGKMFDSSVTRGAPATFQLNRVIPGWTEGLQLMEEGEKTRFWIPEELAYKGRPGAPQGMLVFDVELLEIQEAPKPIPVHPAKVESSDKPKSEAKAADSTATEATETKPAAE